MTMGTCSVGRTVFAAGISLFFGVCAAFLYSENRDGWQGYQFICENDGLGLSVVDVLKATGDHNTFLALFNRYDPEGFAILSDAKPADKTVWAPTDAAFLAISESLSSLSEEEIKAIFGYPISPPRRIPGGSYPIVTPQFLIDAEHMKHRTRTGVPA